MRYSIFDFNQQSCVDMGLNMDDLLLMDYIQKSIGNPKMKHHTKHGLYVWLNHKKILEDLPILNISEETLKKHLKKLVNLGLLCRVVQYNESRRGSKAYYGITDKFINLQFSGVENDTRSPRPSVTEDTRSARARVKNDTPDNGLIINNKKITNNINIISRKPLVKKKSLYESCIDMITAYTKDKPELYDLLEQYLRLRLEIKEKPLYKNQWKGILNKLDKIHKDTGDSYEDIIQFNIEKGYASFFPISKYNSGRKKEVYNENTSNTKWTPEELEEIHKWQEEQIAKDEQITF